MQIPSSNDVATQAMLPPFKSFPVACMEIYMLEQAQRRPVQRDAATLEKLAYIFDWKTHRNYSKALEEGFTLVVTDDISTILWVSHTFLTMTGYTPVEAIGQTPRFLQGVNTDAVAVRRLSDKLTKAPQTRRIRPIRERLLNYRKDGDSYWCEVEIDPIWNKSGELTHFIALEREMNR